MRKLFFLALMGIAMCVNIAKAQNTDRVYDFVSVDKQPEFPGGFKKFYDYLAKAIKYPEPAKRNNVEGRVFLSFIVEKNGALTDIIVIRKLGSGTDEEAIRVLKSSPA
ncbi:energy transducer TonB [Pedobacter rhizosphaerae]|uniref:TonB family C-terminal domain-containing protein n=1 Tax=Pedobacter rhizosphaerae TaxID=390241 RepID=A0A1H9LKG5_9SPHI|nr:TonB family protein [Pedobacter rhizosphaerae]SER11878.1 TonB family C-terminal domain-containing protein [Pedobacter rhizosphaerae]